MNDPHEIITGRDALRALAAVSGTGSVVGVDTEFMRVRTYYPRLCLVQLATTTRCLLIDPLTDVDWEVLRKVLFDPRCVKVMHAARQDLEVLTQRFGAVPGPIFDTQVAAAFVGLGDQIGYAALVRDLLGISMPKSETRTDWCHRPLTDRQLRYAADDVRFLLPIYRELGIRLDRAEIRQWAQQEMHGLTDPANYVFEPDEAYLRLGSGRGMPVVSQYVLKSLAGWREALARSKDLPREWIASDAEITAIASALPANPQALKAVDRIRDATRRRYGRSLIEIVREAVANAGVEPLWRGATRLSPSQRALRQKLGERVAARAGELGLPASLLATRATLTRLVSGDADASIQSGWRREAIGTELEQVMARWPG